MSETAKIYESLAANWAEFVENHDKAMSGNKAAARRARTALQAVKNQVTEYKKASMAE